MHGVGEANEDEQAREAVVQDMHSLSERLQALCLQEPSSAAGGPDTRAPMVGHGDTSTGKAGNDVSSPMIRHVVDAEDSEKDVDDCSVLMDVDDDDSMDVDDNTVYMDTN